MNKTFSQGAQIVTSYRNSKNYGSSWISAGYALWFLRESRFLNYPRSILGSSCFVSGTGFLFSREIAREMNAWNYFLLTEDIEFSADQITRGRAVAYCPRAELFDEQPVDFVTSWNQRMRWSRGYLQVFRKYGKKLIQGCFRGNFSCFDMTMSIMPAFVLSALSILCNLGLGIYGMMTLGNISAPWGSMVELIRNMYGILLVLGSITLITEWKRIRASLWKKIGYLLLFPIFMFTYIPISLASIFCKTTWKPIAHVYSEERLQKEKSI